MAMVTVHTFPGGFILAAMNRIPFVGESPSWLRALVLAAGIGSGIGSHLWQYIGMTPKVRNNLFNANAGVATLNVVFFFTEVYPPNVLQRKLNSRFPNSFAPCLSRQFYLPEDRSHKLRRICLPLGFPENLSQNEWIYDIFVIFV